MTDKIARVFAILFFVFYAIEVSFAQFVTNPDDIIRKSQEEIESIPKKKVPVRELALQELQSLDVTIDQINSYIRYVQSGEIQRVNFDNLIKKIRDAAFSISVFNCDTDISNYYITVNKYGSLLNDLRMSQSVSNDDFFYLILPNGRATELETCIYTVDELKKKLSSDAFENILKNSAASYTEFTQKVDKAIGLQNKLLDVVNSRKKLLEESLNSSSPQQAITEILPLILLILGGSCVLAIVGIKLFDREIQMEWVASGQVIQFVTVMVLLSVITALALSNILKETTLGTLLGGIAGYVLAQGVGRAAARDVSRTYELDRTSMASKPSGSKGAGEAE